MQAVMRARQLGKGQTASFLGSREARTTPPRMHVTPVPHVCNRAAHFPAPQVCNPPPHVCDPSLQVSRWQRACAH